MLPFSTVVAGEKMPWEKKFDVDQVQQKAMEVFWTRGYDATSIQDLLDSVGINRASFYDTFTSKRQVLLDALKRYDATNRRALFEDARRDRSPKESIVWIFSSAAEKCSCPTGRRGCFLVNSALELAPRDREVAAIVNRSFEEIEEFFRVAITEGKKAREISRQIEARSTSRALLGMLLGIRVLSRSGAPKAAIKAIAQQAIALLE
jgi:TetR/AcrR family transcriptional repressor of nem operon